MSIWPKKRCHACKKKFKKDEETAEVRMQTEEGILELEICQECANVFDAVSNALQRIRKKDGKENKSV